MPECLESLEQLPEPCCSTGPWEVAPWQGWEWLGPHQVAHTQPPQGGRAALGWPQKQFLPGERRW